MQYDFTTGLAARPALLAAFALDIWVGVGCAADHTPTDPRIVCLRSCFDGDECTDDVCTEAGECLHLAASAIDACIDDRHCDDGNACTTDECRLVQDCGFNRCIRHPIECDDSDACTLDWCDPTNGCVNHGSNCETNVDCDDNDPCTDDICQPVAGCNMKRCENGQPVGGCLPCQTATDCGAPCQSSECVGHRCVYGPEEPRCDYRCNPVGAAPDGNRDGNWSGFQGIIVPSSTCGSGCTCQRDVALGGGDELLAFVTGEGEPWGQCAVDACGDTTSCAPFVVNRGYFVTGGRMGPPPDGSPVASYAPFVLWLDYFCLSTASDLMVGDWIGKISFTSGASVIFRATVSAPLPDATRTSFVIAIPVTKDALSIPAQTFSLATRKWRLDTSVETSLGALTGVLFSGPDAIEGDLHLPDGTAATLRLEPPR